jgi:hypothetical protein
MALIIADRVRDTTTSTGTGTITLADVAPTGFRKFGDVCSTGDTVPYTIEMGGEWEVGIGTYSATGPTLSRDTIKASSNGGSAVNFSAGTKDVYLSAHASTANFTGLGDTPNSFAGAGGSLVRVKGDASGLEFGDAAFTELSDAPNSFAGAGGSLVRVKGDASGLEFGDAAFTELSDAPNSFAGAGGALVRVNDAASALEFLPCSTTDPQIGDVFRWNGSIFVPSYAREVLTADRTYYVRTDGSDSNDGLTDSSGGAFLTIQKAINTVAALDISTFSVDIRLSAETYTGATIASVTAPWIGSGTVTLKGSSGTILQATSVCVQVSGVGSRLRIDTLDLRSSSNGIQAIAGGFIEFGSGLIFGQCSANHMRSNGPGSKIVTGSNSYTINGNAGVHFNASPGGFIDGSTANVTLTGTPAFSVAFCFSDRLGLATFLAASFSGSATGPRYNVNSNAVINTSGGGANFFPGSTAGTDNSGAGKYL